MGETNTNVRIISFNEYTRLNLNTKDPEQYTQVFVTVNKALNKDLFKRNSEMIPACAKNNDAPPSHPVLRDVQDYTKQIIGPDSFLQHEQGTFIIAGQYVNETPFKLIKRFLELLGTDVKGNVISEEMLCALDFNGDGHIRFSDIVAQMLVVKGKKYYTKIFESEAFFEGQDIIAASIHARWIYIILNTVLGNQVSQKVPDELATFLARPSPADFVPEYEYEHYFFNVDTDNQLQSQMLVNEQAAIINSILSTSQDAKVTFFVQDPQRVLYTEVMIHYLIDPSFHDRVKVTQGMSAYDRWTQDIGETTGGPHSTVMHGWSFGLPGERNAQKALQESSIPEQRIPAVLEGGNITKVRCQGKNLVVVGERDVWDTQRQYWDKHQYDISIEEIKEIYKRAFGADGVVILSNSRYNFHIDQAVFFPRDNTAVLLKLEVEEETKNPFKKEYAKMLEVYKNELTRQGFEIIEIPTNWNRISNDQSYTNSIPITRDGKTNIIMPAFGDRDLEEEILEILEDHDFSVTFVQDYSFRNMGNIHCLTGALAYQDIPQQPSNTHQSQHQG